MSRFPKRAAACITGDHVPLTAPEATVIVIVLVLAVVLATAGMPDLSAIVLLVKSLETAVHLVVRLRRIPAAHAQALLG